MKSYNTYMTKTTLTEISNIQTDKDGTVLGKSHSIYVYIPTIFTVYIIPRSIPVTLIIYYQCIVY